MICKKELSLLRIEFVFSYANTCPEYFFDEYIFQETCWVRAMFIHYARYNRRLMICGNSGYCKLPTVCMKPMEIPTAL